MSFPEPPKDFPDFWDNEDPEDESKITGMSDP